MNQYKPYPEYKNSGVEWLGYLPGHWDVKQLKHLGKFRNGLTITKADLTDTGIACLNYGEIHSLYRFEVNQDIHPLKKVPSLYLQKKPSAYIQHGDIIFADTSEDFDGVGNFSHVSGMDPLFAGYHTIIYSPESDLNSRYLAYCLDSLIFRVQLRKEVKGVKVFSVTQKILRNGIVWLPPKIEQTKISNFLDCETARIDSLVEKQVKLIALLREKRQAIITEAVTKGLDPNVPMKDSGVEWLGRVPEHWNISPLKFISSCNDSVLPDSTNDDYEIEYVEISDINEIQGITGSTHYKFVNAPSRARRMLKDGDVLVSTVRTYLRAIAPVISPAENLIASTGFAVIRPRKGILNGSFLGYLLRAEWWISEVIARSVGVSYPAINATDLISLKVSFPVWNEQNQIALFLDNETARIDSLIEKQTALITLLREKRQAIITEAVTGKIDLR